MAEEMYIDENCKKCRQILYANNLNFNKYIRGFLKVIDEDASISKPAVEMIDKCVKEMFNQVSKETRKVLEKGQKKTFTGLNVKTAARKLLREEMAEIAISKGEQAIERFKESNLDSD